MEPTIIMPTEAATATAPDGRRLVFFTVPQLGPLIRKVMADTPSEVTYQWGYHPGERIHVLLFSWPNQQGAGLAIPEGAGDQVLLFMTGTTNLYLTTSPVQARLQGEVKAEVIDEIIRGETILLPSVKFAGQA